MNSALQAEDNSAPRAETDWSLLERVVRKEESALAALYDRYSGLVFAEAMRILRDNGAAEEILQDIFYQVWRTAEKFDPARGSLPGWLMVVTRNRAISRLRRSSSRSDEELDQNAVSVSINLENAASQKQMIDRLKSVMSAMPDSQRQAIELAFFEGLTHSEIAAKTGEPLGTIKTRIRSALEVLRRSVTGN
ncbi:MAG TPA: sigma-70 family RNA polymerase sigma factor [Candidatus Acidoferrales bacterium]|nr:sigma-70 family RNA polymerase sigma factor [Candidatus Acidoferrales bacterium]